MAGNAAAAAAAALLLAVVIQRYESKNLLALLHIKPRCKPKTREKGEKTLEEKTFPEI